MEAMTLTVAQLDRLTNDQTAFNSFGELTDCCRDGYVPTLMEAGRKGKALAEVRELVRALRAIGLPVFDGFRNYA